MRDADMRREAVRLANVILRLADAPGRNIEFPPDEENMRYPIITGGTDRFENAGIFSGDQLIKGADADGEISIGFEIAGYLVERISGSFYPYPEDFSTLAQQILEAVETRPSLRGAGQ